MRQMRMLEINQIIARLDTIATQINDIGIEYKSRLLAHDCIRSSVEESLHSDIKTSLDQLVTEIQLNTDRLEVEMNKIGLSIDEKLEDIKDIVENNNGDEESCNNASEDIEVLDKLKTLQIINRPVNEVNISDNKDSTQAMTNSILNRYHIYMITLLVFIMMSFAFVLAKQLQ